MVIASNGSSDFAQLVVDQHVQRGDSVANRWRKRKFSRTSECQHLVLISLTKASTLRQILANDVASFLMLTGKDAFLQALASNHVSDYRLQTFVIEFLATWRSQTLARVQDLYANKPIESAAKQLLPTSLTFVNGERKEGSSL